MRISQPVDIVFQMVISVRADGHAIRAVGVPAYGGFPVIGNTVVVRIQRPSAPGDGAETPVAEAGLRFRSVEGTIRAAGPGAGPGGSAAERPRLADHQRVHRIPRQGTGQGNRAPKGRGRIHRGIGGGDSRPRRSKDGPAALVSGQRLGAAAVQSSVQAGVVQVTGEIHALVVVDLVPGKIAAAGRAGDKIIVHDVMAEIGAGVGGVPGVAIVERVVDEDRVDLGQWIPVVRIGEQVVEPGPLSVGRLGVCAELLANGVGVDGILDRNAVDGMGRPIAGGGVHIVPTGELDRHMVQNDIVRLVEIQAIVGAGSTRTGAEPDMPDDNVALAAKGDFPPLDADASARRGLSGDGDVALNCDFGTQGNITAHVEDHDTVARAHRVAKGPGTRIIQVGDMVGRPTPAARGHGTEPHRPRESRHLRLRQVWFKGKKQSNQGKSQGFKGMF